MIREMCCIVCPMSCHMTLEMNEEGSILQVRGNRCPRGEAYARSEAIDPKRMLTTTIRIYGAQLPLLPVMTSQAISKNKMMEVMEVCRYLTVEAPVKMGDTVVLNIADSGADLIASRTMERES
ncbi:MAG: DUF1667 domain-containing protein [Erysipelotrichaceae bacterium]|jgi:CxxC motif-containing protein|nr:DUF1667 domain-containing protein [Erysipelotrichaceae bacterium]